VLSGTAYPALAAPELIKALQSGSSIRYPHTWILREPDGSDLERASERSPMMPGAPCGILARDDPTRPDVVDLWGSAIGVGGGTLLVRWNTQPSSVLSLAGDTEQRVSWATFALR
jgi:hypothetical protein